MQHLSFSAQVPADLQLAEEPLNIAAAFPPEEVSRKFIAAASEREMKIGNSVYSECFRCDTCDSKAPQHVLDLYLAIELMLRPPEMVAGSSSGHDGFLASRLLVLPSRHIGFTTAEHARSLTPLPPISNGTLPRRNILWQSTRTIRTLTKL